MSAYGLPGDIRAAQEIVELITDYLEGAMDAELRASFEAHLAGCPHCTHYLEQVGR